jgi:hypothetical protein
VEHRDHRATAAVRAYDRLAHEQSPSWCPGAPAGRGVAATAAPASGAGPVPGGRAGVVPAAAQQRRDVAAELFGCSQSTVSRRWRALCPLVRDVLPSWKARSLPRSPAAGCSVDGFLARTGNRDGVPLYCGKRHTSGSTCRLVSPDGRIVDTGDPLPGSRHDARAFVDSGIAERWAAHYAPSGPGMTGDKGYLGTGIITPDRKPPETTRPRRRRRTTPGQPHPRRRRTRHRPPQELEDPQDRLSRPADRVPRPATHRHPTGDLPSMGMTV